MNTWAPIITAAVISSIAVLVATLVGQSLGYKLAVRASDRRLKQENLGQLYGLLTALPEVYELQAKYLIDGWRWSVLSDNIEDALLAKNFRTRADGIDDKRHELRIKTLDLMQQLRGLLGVALSLWGEKLQPFPQRLYHAKVHLPPKEDLYHPPHGIDRPQFDKEFEEWQESVLDDVVRQCNVKLYGPMRQLGVTMELQLAAERPVEIWSRIVEACRQFKRRVICCQKDCESLSGTARSEKAGENANEG